MASRFQIFLRKRQHVYSNPQTGQTYNVVVQCNPSTGYAEYVPGDEDNNWYDYTLFIEGADELSLSWDKVNSGNKTTGSTNPDGSNYDKGISTELSFFDAGFTFIFDHLLKSECQILNTIEVKIVDLIAGGTYRIFEIKNDNIQYAPLDEPCQLQVKLREQDKNWHAIHKTFIWDNWQHWFEDSNLKQHPCFLTCIEPRPRLVNSARMGMMFFFFSNPIVSLIAGKIDDDCRRIMNLDKFVDAPLIRTYIQNVASKTGMLTDTIFDVGQPWENLCLFYPSAGFMHESDDNDVLSPSLAFHYENRWLITVAELLDKLKPVFGAEWYVTPNNTIVFKHTKDLVQLAPFYDFTLDTAVPLYDLIYSFNGDKKPAYGRYEYQTDGSDLASQEIATLYNDIIDYDGPANNPMLEGEKTKTNEFAPTGFVRDGRGKDYITLLLKDGKAVAQILLVILTVMVIVLTGGVFTALSAGILAAYVGLWEANILSKYNKMKDKFVNGDTYTGAVRLTSEQVLTPRLLLWDGIYPGRAKVVADSLPPANPYYNPSAIAYNVKNNITQDNSAGKIYNYPLYFDQDFTGNLFDRYHDQIDNPLKSKESHQDVKFNVDLCEDMLKILGVFESQYIAIGKVVKLETRDNYDVFVRIANIQVDYGENKINIKGVVLRR